MESAAFHGMKGGGVAHPVKESPRKSQRVESASDGGPYITTVLKSGKGKVVYKDSLISMRSCH